MTRATRTFRSPRSARRGGTVLIVTMWIMIVLAGMVVVLARSMQVEGICSANHAAGQRAQAVEHGAIQYVLMGLDGLNGKVPTETDLPCNGIQIGYGAFWVIRPNYEDDKQLLYGPVDEASKLSLNTATKDMLSAMPNMTTEIAAAIVDWRDADSVLTEGGAESEFYLLGNNPYECKNAPFESVEELLLVRDITPELLYGEDANRNGVLDANEDDADESNPPDNRDGKLERGIAPLLTIYSLQPNASGGGGRGGAGGGSQQVNVNQAQGQQLAGVLQRSVSQERIPLIIDRTRRERPFSNVFDFYFRTGLTLDEFLPIAESLSTGNDQNARGLVNVNTAPKAVLQCLPGMTEADASALVSARSAEGANTEGTAWVVGVLPREKAVPIGSYITSKSYCFCADIVSVSGDGRAFRRCRVIIDARQSPPRVIRRQDMTYLGWPLQPEILQALRSGISIEEVLQATSQEVW